MSDDRSEKLASIIEMSQHMLTAAQSDDWDKVTALETQREILIGACFSESTSDQDAPYVARAIQEILQLNQSILEFGQRVKSELGKKITTHATGKAALNAYRNCTSDL